MSISSDDHTDSTEESEGEYDSEHDSDATMRMEDDGHAPDGVDLDSDVDMEMDHDDEEDADEEEEEDEDEDNNEDEDDGKGPRTIGQGEMVNTLADDVDTMVDDQPTVLPEHNQEICKHTPQRQPPAPAPRPQPPESRPLPQTLVTHPLCGLEVLGLVTMQKRHPAAPTLQDADKSGNSLDVDVDQQLLGESAGGDSLPDVPLPQVRLVIWVGKG